MKSERREHTPYRCPSSCESITCYFCEGGLTWCTTCGGAEASLPTHCPGDRMSQEREDQVQRKEIDYRDGRWTRRRT